MLDDTSGCIIECLVRTGTSNRKGLGLYMKCVKRLSVKLRISYMHTQQSQTGERLHVLRCEGSVVCVLPLLAIADSSEACLIMTASAEGTMQVNTCACRRTVHAKGV